VGRDWPVSYPSEFQKRRRHKSIFFEPFSKWCQTFAADPVDAPTPLLRCLHQGSVFQQFQVLHNRRACYRQTRGEFTRRHRHARQALKDNYTKRVTEHGEHTQYFSERVRVCV
jgi:hypothetical protein